MEHGVSNGVQSAFINGIHVIVVGMPKWCKSTIWVVLDDIDHWDFGGLINVFMVVCDRPNEFQRKVVFLAQFLRDMPGMYKDPVGVIVGIFFPHKLRVIAANHIQKDAKTSLVIWDMGVFTPILTAEAE